MKRIIIAAIAILMAIASYAQGHMKFKGHDIDGTPAELAQKLVADGFKITQKYSTGEVELQGVFSGYEALLLISPNVNGIAEKVMIVYDVNNYPWKSLKARFQTLEDNLTKKYGEPVTKIKQMDDVLYYDGSSREIQGFRLGKNDYTCAWSTDQGVIGLMIMATSTSPTMLSIWYQDLANTQATNDAAYDDL